MVLTIAAVARSRVNIFTQRLWKSPGGTWKPNERSAWWVRRYNQGCWPVDIYLAGEYRGAAQVPTLEQGILLASNSLDVLTGRRPGTREPLPQTLAEMPELGPIPVGLPAALLDRRPDVRATEQRLAAATERVGVSIAAMYPDLSLTAAGGYQSDAFGR
jgi:hypothetical protein